VCQFVDSIRNSSDKGATANLKSISTHAQIAERIFVKKFWKVNLMNSLIPLLEQRFGLKQFRKGQQEIIESALAARDVLAVLPTGGGKSLCFQYAAVSKNRLVVVISPLIALMKDQVSGLQKRGIPAGALHSGQSDSEKRLVFQEMSKGEAYVLYLSPERVQKEGFQRWIKDRDVALIAIDEAHCVSQWGHDFRPEYTQLKNLRALRPDVPMLALTASATPLVLNDVARALALVEPVRHVHGFYRNNLYYQVESVPDDAYKYAFLTQALNQNKIGRILIYCGTRRNTEEVAQRLQKQFEGVGYYHAGLASGERTRVQSDYEKGKLRILVATNAFGMGIDHPDVRLVVHFNLPANIDSLYQEMGRAGRDGAGSTCVLLYTSKDKGLQSFFIQSSDAPSQIKRSRWNTLNALVAYAEGGECRHSEILTYYQDSQRIQKCGHCDTCDPASPRRILRPNVAERITKLKTKRSAKKTGKVVGSNDDPLNAEEQLRFDLLREWRKSKATELDVPAFVIFSDRTLKHLAKANPNSISELPAIYGFGDTKIERFGKEVLIAIGKPV
jgi:ATP-dependent DNA helicase RecQ